MTAYDLRKNINKMTREEIIAQRDFIETNWNEGMRESIRILSLACINRFNTTLSNL